MAVHSSGALKNDANCNRTIALSLSLSADSWHIMKNADIVLFASKQQKQNNKQRTTNKFVHFFSTATQIAFCLLISVVCAVHVITVGWQKTNDFIY